MNGAAKFLLLLIASTILVPAIYSVVDGDMEESSPVTGGGSVCGGFVVGQECEIFFAPLSFRYSTMFMCFFSLAF